MYSSIAQLVEQTAVNRWVVGSSPTRGAFNHTFGVIFFAKTPDISIRGFI